MPGIRAVCAITLAVLALAACSGGDDKPPTDNEPLPSERVTFYAADGGDHASAIASGDFNHDGALDVALSAPQGDGPGNDRSEAGEVYVFFGPFEPGSSRDAADGEYDAIFFGRAEGDTLGRTLIAADFNADGADDLAMAAPSAAGEAGEVYVMFGGSALPGETDFASADPDAQIRGAGPGDFTGLAMAAGEVNDEPGADLIIGALLVDGPNGDREDAGAVFVVGGEEMMAGEELDLRESEHVVYGAETGDRLGEALTVADMTGDGAADLILVAPFADGEDNGRESAGETYVITSVDDLPLDLATAERPYTVIGVDAGDQLGHSLGAGDTDGDGMSDLWLGAVSADGPQNSVDLAGEAILVPGSVSGGTTVDASSGEILALIYGSPMESRLGRWLATADVNGDGLADLVISAPNELSRAGRVYVFFGGDEYPADTAGADIILAGLGEGDILGHEATGQPPILGADVDGDRRADLLIAAPEGDGPGDNRLEAGEAYLIPGSALGR